MTRYSSSFYAAPTRDFWKFISPTTLRQICNLNTLRLESGSFVKRIYAPLFHDILWSLETSVKVKVIYVVIEHQSRRTRIWHFG